MRAVRPELPRTPHASDGARRSAVCLVAVVAACAAPASPVPPPSRTPGAIVDGFYVEAGAPPALACASDVDCVVTGTVDATGCCWSYRDMNATAQSTAYARWIEGRRSRECADVACPSPPVPTVPPDCLFEVRCDTGRSICVNACP